MGKAILNLPMHRARETWRQFEEQRAAVQRAQERLRNLCDDLSWASTAERDDLAPRRQQAELELREAEEKLALARRTAILASGQAASLEWGVRLGHSYTFRASDDPVGLTFVVDYLRPVSLPDIPAGMVCSGGEACMVVLGEEGLSVEPHASTVVHLSAFLPTAK